MQPRSKFQKEVFAASQMLPAITEGQTDWAYRECLEHVGRRLKSGVITCIECGHSWTDKTAKKNCTCPQCYTELVVQDTKRHKFTDYEYFCIVTAFRGFQVLRFVYVENKGKAGERVRYFYSEVVQRWIAPNGKHATIARLRTITFHSTTWNFGSKLEIRPEKSVHNIISDKVYPGMHLTPEIRRSGFDYNFYELSPFDMFRILLSENKAETLLKTGQTGLLRYFVHNGFHKLESFWASVKICIRNGYHVKDASIWCDYIDLLRFFDKDIHNAKYVCPANLKAEHDKLVVKKQEFLKRQKAEKAKIKALADEACFNELKSRFFGIEFSDGTIHIRVLESAKEVMQEGEALHHCVFTNEYHLKPDTLILSACIGDKRLETVELSLSELKVLQCRGLCNQNTEYHDRIINLVSKNIPKIKKRIAA